MLGLNNANEIASALLPVAVVPTIPPLLTVMELPKTDT